MIKRVTLIIITSLFGCSLTTKKTKRAMNKASEAYLTGKECTLAFKFRVLIAADRSTS